jgi:hypothetical protein
MMSKEINVFRLVVNGTPTRWTFYSLEEAYDFCQALWLKNGGGNHASIVPYQITPTDQMLSLSRPSHQTKQFLERKRTRKPLRRSKSGRVKEVA